MVQAEFQLTSDEMQELESAFGEGVLGSDIVQISVNYKNIYEDFYNIFIDSLKILLTKFIFSF